MLFPAWRGRARASADEDPVFDDDGYSFEFEPGERIGEPLPARGSSLPGAILMILIMSAAAWGWLYAPAEWLSLLGERAAAVASLMSSTSPAAVTSEVSTIATADATIPAAPVPETQAAEAPAVSGDAVPDPVTKDGAPVETASIDPVAAAPAPLPPPRVDPGDPYQKRAVAVGLHPDLSRVLL